MFKRIMLMSAVALVSVLSAQSQAQQDVSPDQQQQIQQLQDTTNQMRQNLQNAGIDPQQLMQQLQSGQLDPQQLQQQLINQGIISQDMMNQLQSGMRSLTLTTVRQQLASTDEEWAVLQPKVQRIIAAMGDVDQQPQNRLQSRLLGNSNPNSPMALARQALQAAVADPNTGTDRLSMVLAQWRAAHRAAKVELEDARTDLISILTLRQEGVLLTIGLL